MHLQWPKSVAGFRENITSEPYFFEGIQYRSRNQMSEIIEKQKALPLGVGKAFLPSKLNKIKLSTAQACSLFQAKNFILYLFAAVC
jgi:hypothetical protein